jgi:lipid-A-disaccharide synthase
MSYHSQVALVARLETQFYLRQPRLKLAAQAVAHIPENNVLIYKASASTYFLGRRLIQVKYLGLVNLLLNKPAVPEFIQNEARPDKIAAMAVDLLRDDKRMAQMREDFLQVRKTLGETGASSRAAAAVISYLRDAPSQAQDTPKVHSR